MASSLQKVKELIDEITPQDTLELQQDQGLLIDIRDDVEVAAGTPVEAIHISKSFLELKIEGVAADKNKALVLMCASGSRSAFAVKALLDIGYNQVKSLAGGFNRWKDEGLAIEIPKKLSLQDYERYSRHLVIPEVGEAGQLKLLESRILIIGAGGIGSPAAYYLAAAGIGTLGIVDHDVVDKSNLQRQILHTEATVGEKKVSSAKAALMALNSDISVITHECRLNKENVDQIFSGYDLIVDGSDNFPTRYLINDACVKMGIPNIHGAVFQFEGYVTVYYPKEAGCCYRCLYPEPLPQELAPNCAEAGVLGVLPGVIGLLEAVEAIKIVLGIGESLVSKMLCYDALLTKFTILDLEQSKSCKYCHAASGEYPEYVDYEKFCSL